MSKGINLGDAAMALLARDRLGNYGDNGPNITQAVAALEHLTATKAELLEALAYTALQAGAYRHMANQDAALALHNIESVIRNYRERRA